MRHRSDQSIRAIAFCLPQFHPIPENDEWWGKGFTEWTNTAKAKPLFRGHYQPHVPADLGFYDLRLPEARAAQANLAHQYGIEAFCYYHYWFAGRQLLQRPVEAILTSGEPDFPFCLCWANETWTGIWHGAPNRVLIEQTYPGEDDHRRHFNHLLRAFADPRYVRVDGKPLFVVYRPEKLPDSRRVTDLWRDWALHAGLPGLYLMAEHHLPDWDPAPAGFDARLDVRLPQRRRDLQALVTWQQHPWTRLRHWAADKRRLPTIHSYASVADSVVGAPTAGIRSFPCVVPNWDNTPRSGADGMLLQGSTPELFRPQLCKAVAYVRDYPAQERLVFIKSWNEWAEGNHLEPDLRFGHGYLEVVREELVLHGGDA
jgi:lipopolysaccharide biosynthesis protein